MVDFKSSLFGIVLTIGLALTLAQDITETENPYNALLPLLKDRKVCMKDLGCFEITADFQKRPLNLLPNDRALINTKFMLYTKKNLKDEQYLDGNDKKSLTKSNFDKTAPTVFIVHGYLDSEKFGRWMSKTKDEFLMHSPHNIILVDWGEGNKNLYSQATANTRVVGAEIAFLFEALKKQFGIKAETCHIIGHSLGSHIAGYAGERIKNLGRITGADPAGPLFEGMPTSVRLDPSDAQFVDIIHTNTGLLGIVQLVGHVDFFVNGGAVQPGCRSIKQKFKVLLKDGINELFRSLTNCHHQRAVEFMMYSVNHNKVTPVAYECDSYESYLAGKCTTCDKDMRKCAILGMRAIEYKPYVNTEAQRSFFITTGPEGPFWMSSYEVVIKLFKPKGKYDDMKIDLELNLHGSKEDQLSSLLKGQDIVHGDEYRFVITTKTDLGDMKSISLKWAKNGLSILKILSKPKLYIDYVLVNPLNVVEKEPRSTKGRAYCGSKETAIDPKTVTYIKLSDKCKIG